MMPSGSKHFSDAAREVWQKLSKVGIPNLFRFNSKKTDDAPQYWQTGSAEKVKDYLGWDLDE